jgi:hypothetical protein
VSIADANRHWDRAYQLLLEWGNPDPSAPHALQPATIAGPARAAVGRVLGDERNL